MDKQLQATQFLLYKAENGKIKVDVLIEDETVWLTIEQMAELFGKGRSTINEHILNIYQDGKLEKEESMRKIGNEVPGDTIIIIIDIAVIVIKKFFCPFSNLKSLINKPFIIQHL
jgi:hypothetical protein